MVSADWTPPDAERARTIDEACVAQSRAAKGVIGRKWQDRSHAASARRMVHAQRRSSVTNKMNARPTGRQKCLLNRVNVDRKGGAGTPPPISASGAWEPPGRVRGARPSACLPLYSTSCEPTTVGASRLLRPAPLSSSTHITTDASDPAALVTAQLSVYCCPIVHLACRRSSRAHLRAVQHS